jgi:hypothetical protein
MPDTSALRDAVFYDLGDAVFGAAEDQIQVLWEMPETSAVGDGGF